MSERQRLIVVIDKAGQVVGATFSGESNTPGVQVGITALPGQEVHDVDVPGDLAGLGPEELLRAVVDYGIRPGGSELEQRPRRAPGSSS